MDYRVVGRFVAEDGATQPLDRILKKVKEVETGTSKLKSSVSGIGSLFAKSLAIVGGGALFGLMARQALKAQTEVQNAKVGIASLYNALAKVPMKSALAIAADDVRKLTRAAAQGAGGLQDYLDAYGLLMGPGFKAGANRNQLLEMTKNVLTAGFALRGQEGLKLAPLDIVQAMTGSVNERVTPIATQALRSINVTNEQFNKMSQPERWQTLLKGFGSFKEAALEMGKSWEAQSATFKDNLKGFMRTATGPLFERGTKELQAWNKWIEQNHDRLNAIAENIGPKLVAIFEQLKKHGMDYLAVLGTAALVGQVAPAMPVGSMVGGLMGLGGLAMPKRRGAPAGPSMPEFIEMTGVGRVKNPNFKPAKTGFGTSMAGLIGGAGASAGGMLASGFAIATVVGLVVTSLGALAAGALGVYGAVKNIPGVLNPFWESLDNIKMAFGDLSNSVFGLTGEGSPLNQLGEEIVKMGTKTANTIALLTEAAALMVDTGNGLLNTIAQYKGILRYVSPGLYYAMEGSDFLYGKIGDRFDKRRRKKQDQLLLEGAADEKFFGKNYFTSDVSDDYLYSGNRTFPSNITNIGTVNINQKLEQNADPARVATSWKQMLNRVNQHPTQAKRLRGVG